MYKHFKLGFSFFRPRLYLKEISTKLDDFYTLKFWCVNRMHTNNKVCLCHFFMSVKLRKNVQNTPEFFESFKKYDEFDRQKKFPHRCEKQTDFIEGEYDEK